MASLRTIGVPLDHLVAELIAFPLSSEWALRHPTTVIDPAFDAGTRQLWEATEKQLLTTIPGFSVEELIALRDAIWFRGSASRPRLHEYLRAISSEFLAVAGTHARPKLPQFQDGLGAHGGATQVEARQAFRWLSFALPRDLLCAGHPSPSASVDLLSPALTRTLADKGYAETHLHLGAGLDFETLWPGTLSLIGSRAFQAGMFESTGAELDSGRELASWLLHAAIARYLLGMFLAQPGRTRRQGFVAYLGDLRSTVARIAGVTAYSNLRQVLLGLRSGTLRNVPFVELREIYAQLTGARTIPPARTLSDWQAMDPLWLCYGGSGLPPELALVRAGLAYLATAPSDGALFEGVFWQVVRVRCALYRYVVQRPMTPGLEWFVRFYNRMARSRHAMPDAIKTLANAQLCGAAQGLRSLEFRTAPDATPAAVLQQVKQVGRTVEALQRMHSPLLEVGLVYHFIKERGASAAHWARSHADPTPPCERDPAQRRRRANLSGVRYGTLFGSRRRQAQALVWVLHHFPDSVRLIRGVDVCTDELGVPNWVLAPLVHYVRRAAHDAARATNLTTRFGTTIHAGEDFVHLLTGLRNLDEAVDVYGLCEGDRIGHGLALGVEPTEWARRAGRLAVLVEDRLFDLVWVWHWLSRNSGGGGGAHLDREIRDRARDMFGAALSPHEVLSLMRQLGRESDLRNAGFPGDRPAIVTPSVQRLIDYLTDPKLFRAGRKTVWIDPLRDREILVEVQNAVRQKVAAHGITVEVNPTSNLLIGDFGNLSAHPLWRLRPPRPDPQHLLPELSLAIGSDDPVVFASSIREEYQWLMDAMRIAGISDEEARAWIDRTRQCSLECRFTLSEPIGPIAVNRHPRGNAPLAPF